MEFVELVFARVNLDWRKSVSFDPRLTRPLDIFASAGNAAKARDRLGWSPSVALPDLIGRLIDAELHRRRTQEIEF
jgi:GDPmannose 4,6-dehydratase